MDSDVQIERLLSYAGFALSLIGPILCFLFYLIFRRLPSPHAFIFGRHETSLPKMASSICFLTVAPLHLLLPVVLQYPGGVAVIVLAGGYALAAVFVGLVILPVLHYAKSASICQYLRERYGSSRLQRGVAALLVLYNVIYNTLLLAVCAEMASVIFHLSPSILVAILGVAAPLAAIFGGQSAVVNVQFWQLFAVALLGLGATVYRSVQLDFLNLNLFRSTVEGLDSADYYGSEGPNLLAVFLFSIVVVLHTLATNQAVFLHYNTQGTLRRLRLAVCISSWLCVIYFGLVLVFGLAFHGVLTKGLLLCKTDSVTWNPYKGLIEAIHYLWQETRYLHAVFGFVVAGIVGSCATIYATNLVAMTTVFWEDFMRHKYNNSKEAHQVAVMQMCLTLFACVAIVTAVLCVAFIPDFWQYILKLFLTLATLSAPVTAIYIAGITMPCTNHKGACAGLLFGTAAALLLSVGHLYYQPLAFHTRPTAYSTTQCKDAPMENGTSLELSSSSFYNDTWASQAANDTLFSLLNDDASFELSSISTDPPPTATFLSVLSPVLRLTQLYHTPLVFVMSLLVVWLVSALSGGQDVYLLDWNLVAWTCTNKGGCCRCFSGGSGSRRRHGGRAPFVASDSFRYAHHGTQIDQPLPDNTCHNPKLKQYYMAQQQQHSLPSQTTVLEA